MQRRPAATRERREVPPYLANERPGPCVYRHMPGEVIMGIEDLATFRAGKALLWFHGAPFAA